MRIFKCCQMKNAADEFTLLKRVAESTVIFFPIFQLGCFKASATLTSFNFSTGQSLLVNIIISLATIKTINKFQRLNTKMMKLPYAS